MKKLVILFLCLSFTFFSCEENKKLKEEIHILNVELSNCKEENKRLKDTPEQLLVAARKEKEVSNLKAKSILYRIIQDFPDSKEAKIAKKEIIEIDNIISDYEKDKKLHPEKYSPKISDQQAKNLLSSWNGSLPTLVDYVKKSMHNPKSFEHVETGISNKGTYLKVKMIYRGTNGFGAIITESIIAKVDGNGKILEILQ